MWVVAPQTNFMERVAAFHTLRQEQASLSRCYFFKLQHMSFHDTYNFAQLLGPTQLRILPIITLIVHACSGSIADGGFI